MSEDRFTVRIKWVAIGVAVAFVGLAVVCLAYVSSYISRDHSGWREAVPEAIQDYAWLPLMAAAWWIKIRVANCLNGKCGLDYGPS